MSDNAKMPLRIVVDSREQCPFRFEGFNAVVTVGTLEAGDYSLAGFERKVAVERKSLGDLIGCLSGDRARFEKELARLRGFDACAVVVESSQPTLRLGHYRSAMDAGSAWQSCLAFMQRFNVPFIWCNSRQDAEQVTFDFLRHYHRDRVRELEALRIPARIAPAATERRGPGVGMDGRPDTPQGRTGGKGNPLPRAPAGTRP
jgi:DNA excision repair protein ERCC-4